MYPGFLVFVGVVSLCDGFGSHHYTPTGPNVAVDTRFFHPNLAHDRMTNYRTALLCRQHLYNDDRRGPDSSHHRESRTDESGSTWKRSNRDSHRPPLEYPRGPEATHQQEAGPPQGPDKGFSANDAGLSTSSGWEGDQDRSRNPSSLPQDQKPWRGGNSWKPDRSNARHAAEQEEGQDRQGGTGATDEEREHFARREHVEAYGSNATPAFSTAKSSSSRADLDLKHDGRAAGEQWAAALGERERGVDERRSEQASSRGSPSKDGDPARDRTDWTGEPQGHRTLVGGRSDIGGRGDDHQFAGGQGLNGSHDDAVGADGGSRGGCGNAGGSDGGAGCFGWAGRKRSQECFEREDGSRGPGPKKVNGDAVENSTRRSSSYS